MFKDVNTTQTSKPSIFSPSLSAAQAPTAPTFYQRDNCSQVSRSTMSLSRNVPGDAPALARLMNAFNRWHQEDLPNEPITLSLLHAHLPGPLPVPAAVAFLNALPLIDLADIPEDNRTCEICTAPYHSLAELSATNHSVEAAIRTPCGHLFGNHCL